MKNVKLILLGSFLFILSACSSSGNAVSDNKEVNDLQAKVAKSKKKSSRYENAQNLTEVFRTVSGVRVAGNGNNTEVQVMGLTTAGTPLFVINGVSSSASFADLNGIISPKEIKKIKVLRSPTELSMYGVRGAAGVIEIKLK